MNENTPLQQLELLRNGLNVSVIREEDSVIRFQDNNLPRESVIDSILNTERSSLDLETKMFSIAGDRNGDNNERLNALAQRSARLGLITQGDNSALQELIKARIVVIKGILEDINLLPDQKTDYEKQIAGYNKLLDEFKQQD